MKPRIIKGICEYCGIPADECPHHVEGVELPEPNHSFPQYEGDETVEIVLIQFNLPEAEEEAIRCVHENTEHPYKLTTFDNYKDNYPLSDLWNEFARQTDCKYICFLNNDAFVSKGWLKEMMRAFNDPNTGAVGPSGDNVGGKQRSLKQEDVAKRKGKFELLEQLSGYCFVVKTELFKKGVWFPHEVPFYGNEHAWCNLARKAGYELYWAQGAWVSHLGEASGKKEGTVTEMRRDGQQRFVKWLAKQTPVLFTTYNRLDYTKRSLPKLIKSTTGQIYVYDNASTDGTQEYLKSLKSKKLKVHLADKNTGVAGAMNWFFSQTKRDEFVAKVDNDTLVEKDWLVEMLKMTTWRSLDIVQARHYILNETYDTFEEWCQDLKQDVVTPHVHYSNFVGGSGVVIRRFRITDEIPETEWVLGGWTRWQELNSDLKKAFIDNVFVELIDMEDDNKPRYEDYKDYYKEVGRAKVKTLNIAKTLPEILTRLGQRFAYTRFGDGELMMLNGSFEGHEHTQYNSSEFQQELIESFEIDDPGYLIGNVARMPKEEKAGPGFFMPFDNDDKLMAITKDHHASKTFYNPVLFHYIYATEPLLWKTLVNLFNKYRIGFVGGEHLEGISKVFKVQDVVSTPSSQAYNTIDDWYPEVYKIAKENDIILLCLSMTANVVQKRLWKSRIKVGTIDLGSVANAIVNYKHDNHTWIQKL